MAVETVLRGKTYIISLNDQLGIMKVIVIDGQLVDLDQYLGGEYVTI